jgi:hypothetical protein
MLRQRTVCYVIYVLWKTTAFPMRITSALVLNCSPLEPPRICSHRATSTLIQGLTWTLRGHMHAHIMHSSSRHITVAPTSAPFIQPFLPTAPMLQLRTLRWRVAHAVGRVHTFVGAWALLPASGQGLHSCQWCFTASGIVTSGTR